MAPPRRPKSGVDTPVNVMPSHQTFAPTRSARKSAPRAHVIHPTRTGRRRERHSGAHAGSPGYRPPARPPLSPSGVVPGGRPRRQQGRLPGPGRAGPGGALPPPAAVVPGMTEAGDGVAVNLGSRIARLGVPLGTLCSSTKGATETLTRAWATEFGPLGVRVNAVSPGVVLPPAPEGGEPRPGEVMMEGTPAGSVGTPDAIAHVVVWPASDEAAFVHGTVVDVDGERCAGRAGRRLTPGTASPPVPRAGRLPTRTAVPAGSWRIRRPRGRGDGRPARR